MVQRKKIGVSYRNRYDIFRKQSLGYYRVSRIVTGLVLICIYSTFVVQIYKISFLPSSKPRLEPTFLRKEIAAKRNEVSVTKLQGIPPIRLPDVPLSYIKNNCLNQQSAVTLQELFHNKDSTQCSKTKLLNIVDFFCNVNCSIREPELEFSTRILNLAKYKYDMLYKQCKQELLFSAIIYISDNEPYFMVCSDRVRGSQLWKITQRIIVNILCLVRIPDVVFGFDNSDWAVPSQQVPNSVPGWNQPLPGLVRYVGTDSQPSLLFPTGQYLKSTTHCMLSSENPVDWRRICRFDENPKEFSEKEDLVLWRGSSTGVPMRTFYLDYLPRSALVSKYSDKEGFDVGFIGGPPPSNNKEYLSLFHKHSKNYIKPQKFQSYKYILHMDGHTASWGLSQKLGFTKSATLWVKSSFTYREHFYKLLTPWVHYVPISSDLSDLISIKNYLFQNDEVGEKIGRNAFDLFRKRLAPEATYCYILRLLLSLAKHQDSEMLSSINKAEYELFPEYLKVT